MTYNAGRRAKWNYSTATSFALLTLASAGPAMAQSTPPAVEPSDQATLDSSDARRENDIVVTANRREEAILEVPISMSAYSRETLDERGVRNFNDIVRITPGIRLTSDLTANGTNISIRGIVSSVGASTTAIYIDDTPIQTRGIGQNGGGANAYPAVFDLDRVEVLRGPQGTLFGANSEGGNVRFISASPGLSSYSGYGRAELAFTENGSASYELGGAVGGPIVQDTLGFRISAYGRHDGGWIDRVPRTTTLLDGPASPPEEDANSGSTYVFNAALTYAGIAGLTLTPSIYYQRRENDDGPGYWRHLSNRSRRQYVNGQLSPNAGTDEFYLAALRGELDLGGVSIFSNTSFFDRKENTRSDYTFVSIELLSGNFTGPTVQATSRFGRPQEIFTQEARLQSTGSGPFKWVIGGFYQRAEQGGDQFVSVPNFNRLTLALFGATVPQVFGSDLLQPGGIAFQTIATSTESQVAGFGQIEYTIWDKLTLLAGARVSQSDYKYTSEGNGPFNGGRTLATGKQKESPITPKFGINFKPSDDLLLYTSAAKGFRGGGANSPLPVTCGPDLAALNITAAPDDFSSDSVWSYEIGAKGKTLGRALVFEVSAFRIDWSDIQSSLYLSRCGLQFVSNLGSARSQGFDAQINLTPVEGLNLNVSGGYTDAKFTQDIFGSPDATGVKPQLRRNGQSLGIPPFHISVTAEYTFAVAQEWDSYVHGSYDYNGQHQVGDPSFPGFDPTTAIIHKNGIAAARIGVRHAGVDVSLFVDNLLNSTDLLSIARQVRNTDLYREIAFRPRTVGLTVSGRF